MDNSISRKLVRPNRECFCIELHMHTSQSSACGRGTPEQMVRTYKEAGYDGIVVTDHFMNGNTCVDRDLPWEEQVDSYCLAYEKAKIEGDKIGLSVFFGFEYNYFTTEFITLGLDKAWIKAHPEILHMEPQEYLTLVRKSGGLAIHAHPYREASYISVHRFYPEYVDAVEVINLGNRDDKYNQFALRYAREHNLPMTSGSDCHSPRGQIGAGIAMNERPEKIEDIVRCIKSGTGYTLLGAGCLGSSINDPEGDA